MQEGLSGDDGEELGVGHAEAVKVAAVDDALVHDRLLHLDDVVVHVVAQVQQHVLHAPAQLQQPIVAPTPNAFPRVAQFHLNAPQFQQQPEHAVVRLHCLWREDQQPQRPFRSEKKTTPAP